MADEQLEKNQDNFETYEEFWPHYLSEHSNPKTRKLHYLGSGLALTVLAGAALTKKPALLLAVPVAGYGPAWIAHFKVEKNKPTTFRYPLWSLISDFRMFYLWLTQQMDAELNKHSPEAKEA
ncbi:g11805 [Coccomyxa viridis]|uniref:G11805 protein n=1 Tax=Coccomyxa viridis TaxID=1274662 RepID=A0ABP1GEG3_9CHLO